jgi:hypothetical protein
MPQEGNDRPMYELDEMTTDTYIEDGAVTKHDPVTAYKVMNLRQYWLNASWFLEQLDVIERWTRPEEGPAIPVSPEFLLNIVRNTFVRHVHNTVNNYRPDAEKAFVAAHDGGDKSADEVLADLVKRNFGAALPGDPVG